MVDHTAVYSHDPTMAIPGHASGVVYVVETKSYGLHCGGEHVDGCGWYGGGFKGRSADKKMHEAWDRHVEFVQYGGVIEHGQASNVVAGICRCVTCSIPYRHLRSAAEDKRAGRWTRCGYGDADCACLAIDPVPSSPDGGDRGDG